MNQIDGASSIGEQFVEGLYKSPGGGYLAFVEVVTEPVSDNPRIWFCKNTFTVLQVRTKNPGDGQAHDFPFAELNLANINHSKGSVHNLKCQRSGAELQVKLIPGLSCLDLVNPPPWNTARDVEMMLLKLQAVAALYYLVMEFHRDPTLLSAPLDTASNSFRQGLLDCLAKDREALLMFLHRSNIFVEQEENGRKVLALKDPADAAKPRTRGIILKAAVELKMLVVIVVEHCDGHQVQNTGTFTPQQEMDYTNFVIGIHEDMVKGAADAQYRSQMGSWNHLKALLLGTKVIEEPKTPEPQKSQHSSNPNDGECAPSSAEGLQNPMPCGLFNPGENLCGTNALLQLLYSVKPFVKAILEAPVEEFLTTQAEKIKSGTSSSKEGNSNEGLILGSLEFITGLKRLFLEMATPGKTCSAKDVAASLYFEELGTQQDADELWYRIALYIEDGLDLIEGKPFKELQEVFRRLFKGSSVELKVRRRPHEDGLVTSDFDPEAADKNTFLTIMVQGDISTLNKTLDETSEWTSRDHKEVSWVQERYLKFPPFLCFATKQVAQLRWEDTLDLAPYATPMTPEQSLTDFKEFLGRKSRKHVEEIIDKLPTVIESTAEVMRMDSDEDWKQDLDMLAGFKAKMEAKLRALPEVVVRSHRLSSSSLSSSGQGINSLSDFLLEQLGCTTVDDSLYITRITMILTHRGVQTPEEAAELLFDNDSEESRAAMAELEKKLPDGIARTCLDTALAKLKALKTQPRLVPPPNTLYEIHGLVVYQGSGTHGHYIAFLRQEDGTFMGFDDESTHPFHSPATVRAEIVERGCGLVPTSVRLVVYKRVGAETEPLDCTSIQADSGSKRPGESLGGNSTGPTPATESPSKRPRRE